MNDIVIKAENLGKKYIIGHQTESGRYMALRDVLMQNARTLWNKTKDLATGKPIIQGDTMEEVWALKDVSFEIRRGEAVGIIGRNGAGKSTLLKILSRITEPTTGRVTIRGRVASLLEVGTGFHPELSGRENIYLNGTILGMTRVEIKQKFDEIVAFAEVEKYLDTPVKRYSSGMYVRLAFAVAAHLEPEILVVDEVLAVGDAEFQKKCIGRMNEVASEGRTVLFVSHNMGAIKSLCSRGMLLNAGSLICIDIIETVITKYLTDTLISSKQFISGTKDVRLTGFKIFKNKQLVDSFNTFDNVSFFMTYNASEELNDVTIAICFNNTNNVRVTSLWTSYINQSFSIKKGLNSFKFNVERIKLIPGMYEIILYAERKGMTLERIDKFKQIVVGTPAFYGNTKIPTFSQGLYIEDFQVENA